MKIAIVMMFLNEERYLDAALDGLAQQTRAPDKLILLDDGSTDGSTAIAARFVEETPWAELRQRPPRPPERDRLKSAQLWNTFQSTVADIDPSYDVVAKLDADIVLTPRALQEIEEHFVADPKLGLTGPAIAERQPDGTLQTLRGRPEHVNGATKFWRRAAWDDVFPMAPLLNFDMVDEVRARMHGWRTATFTATDGESLHLRPMGSEGGTLQSYRRWGAGEYASGGHPLLVLYIGSQHLRARPVGGLNYFAGWISAAARRAPRYDAGVRRFRRREQMAVVRERVLSARERERPRPA